MSASASKVVQRRSGRFSIRPDDELKTAVHQRLNTLRKMQEQYGDVSYASDPWVERQAMREVRAFFKEWGSNTSPDEPGAKARGNGAAVDAVGPKSQVS
jgi:hypothetical protein